MFFPGRACNAVQWERVIPFFLSEYTCYAVEPRGQGRSDRAPDGDYRLTACIAEVVQFVDTVVGMPAILVGQSAGGFTAMGVAAQRPELVRGIYSEDAVPVLYTGQSEEAPPALLQFFRIASDALEQSEMQDWSVLQFAAGLAAALPTVASANPNGLVDLARTLFGADPRVWRGTADGVSLSESQAIESALSCPLHIAQADPALGGIVTDAHLDHLREAGVDFTTTYFPGAGHMITATQLKPFLADLRAFLSRLPEVTP